MGYNLYARCMSRNQAECFNEGEVAFVYRRHEAEGIAEWYKRHRLCEVEWAVDHTHSTPGWVDSPPCEPTELPQAVAERNAA
jgi:hypothetical protein